MHKHKHSRDDDDNDDNRESRDDMEASVRWRRPDVMGRKLRSFEDFKLVWTCNKFYQVLNMVQRDLIGRVIKGCKCISTLKLFLRGDDNNGKPFFEGQRLILTRSATKEIKLFLQLWSGVEP